MNGLKDKVAVVTGAAQGLGRAISFRLADEGVRVLAADLNDELAKETAEIIKRKGGEAFAVKVDVTQEESTIRMAETAQRLWGRIDILVNNAAFYGGISRKPFYELEPSEWDKVMAVNAKGPWLCIRAVFPVMKKVGKGKIINMSSETFFTGSHNLSHYVASKGAVLGITHALARELGPFNISVNAVAPGFTDTMASRTIIVDINKYDVSLNCIKRLGQPQDIAGVVIFLASDESDFLTGQTIIVDGGRYMI